MKRILFPLLLILFFAITGCYDIDSADESLNSLSPSPDNSIIHGQIISIGGEPQEGVIVRLAKVYRGANSGGAYVLDEARSPLSITDNHGKFILEDIDPGEYVLFLGSLDTRYQVVSDTEQEPIIFNVDVNEVLELEPIILDLD